LLEDKFKEHQLIRFMEELGPIKIYPVNYNLEKYFLKHMIYKDDHLKHAISKEFYTNIIFEPTFFDRLIE
jgi:hypothetical protein